MGYILLENCSDFTSRLGLVYISMWVSCGGRFRAIVFVNLLGLCVRPHFSGCLNPMCEGPLAQQGWGREQEQSAFICSCVRDRSLAEEDSRSLLDSDSTAL